MFAVSTRDLRAKNADDQIHRYRFAGSARGDLFRQEDARVRHSRREETEDLGRPERAQSYEAAHRPLSGLVACRRAKAGDGRHRHANGIARESAVLSRCAPALSRSRKLPSAIPLSGDSQFDAAFSVADQGRSQAAHAFKEHSVLLQLVRFNGGDRLGHVLVRNLVDRSTLPQVIALRRTKRRYRRLAPYNRESPPDTGAVRASDKYAGPCA